jgi:hypothetical protein
VTGAEFGGVDIDLLADYIGGALTGTPEESAVAAWLADDPAWQTAYASLSEGMVFVSAELRRFEPEPMPADLAARLDATLTDSIAPFDATLTDLIAPFDATLTDSIDRLDGTAAELDSAGQPSFLDLVARGAEPTLTADQRDNEVTGPAANPEPRDGDGTGPGSIADPEPITGVLAQPPTPHLALVRGDLAVGDVSNPVRKMAPESRRGRRLRWAAPIAVAAGLIAFVGFGLDYLAGRDSVSSSTSSAASGGGSADRKAATPPLARPLTTAQLLASGTDYTHATLGVAPVTPMTAPFSPDASPAIREASPGLVAGGGSALKRLTGSAALADCLAAIEQANARGAISVESVDYARFGRAPAVIVRFTAANGQWAWASGADCGTPAGDAATLDKVPVG